MDYLSKRRGFTLVELMVGAAIIGILMSLLLPAVAQVRAATKRTICLNNLRQIAVATHNFESATGILPPAARLGEGTGWHAYILPYIEREDLYEQIFLTDPLQEFEWASDGEEVLEALIPLFRCPVDPAPPFISSPGIPERAVSSYTACASGTQLSSTNLQSRFLEYRPSASSTPNMSEDFVREFRSGAMPPTQPFIERDPSSTSDDYPELETKTRFADLLDGQSNTIMIGETIFDTTRHFNDSGTSAVNVGADHWYIGSGTMDISISSGAANPVSDLSEFMSSSALRFNLYHFNRAKLNFTGLSGSAGSRLRDNIAFSFNSWHAGNGLNFVFADGSTKFVDADVDDVTRSRLGTIADGQELDFF